MSTPIRWGIAATGGIATRFASDMALVPDGHAVAVASRTVERAEAFAGEHGIARAHGSYEALAEDPDVDVVYVASPHVRHASDTLMFLEAGKPVLCEKPFALDLVQATAMVAAARERGLFLMEAIWSRFLPAYHVLRDLLGEERIGPPTVVDADFGFARPIDPVHRLFDRALGGGALLDLGIYPLQLCSLVLGPPTSISAVARLGETGVDEQVAAVLGHEGGGVGTVRAALRSRLTCEASISGSEGRIALPAFMHCPDHVVLETSERRRIDCAYEGTGLQHEIAEVQRCLAEGLTESPLLPLSETLRLAATMDEVRAQIGLTYPGEEAGQPLPPGRVAVGPIGPRTK